MKSFPTTLNKGGTTNSRYGNRQAELYSKYQNAANGTTGDNAQDIEGLKFDTNGTSLGASEYININPVSTKFQSIKSANLDNGAIDMSVLPGFSSQNHLITQQIENPFKMPAEVLSTMNRYKRVYAKSIVFNTDKEKTDTFLTSKENQTNAIIGEFIGAGSIFNPYKAVQVVGMSENTPLLNREFKKGQVINAEGLANGQTESNLKVDNSIWLQNHSNDWTDCSIKKLVSLSKLQNNSSRLGRAVYRYADFMYCKDLGKLANNHLITLRKFPTPIGDNIFKHSNKKGSPYEISGDIGRLITWFGTEDNKLENILKYSYKASWKKLDSKIQQVETDTDSKDRGIIGKVINSFNPNYTRMQQAGFTGTQNIWSALGGRLNNKLLSRADIDLGRGGQYENHKILTNYDKNKIYEPKNTIKSNHIYEGTLTFNQTIELTFKYKLRYYDNINPKSAFLDLLANILQVTYRKGRFWGGSRKFIGPQQDTSAWNKSNSMINKVFDAGSNIGNKIFDVLGSDNVLKSTLSALGDLGNSIMSGVKNLASSVENADTGKMKETVLNVAKKGLKMASNGAKGQIKNALGRPQVYALDSLLSGDNVGLWHLTIGNPLNPIAVIGNLIIDDDVVIQHSGELGIDDFPSEISVTVKLKPAKPRDIDDIERMYTRGLRGIYMPLSQRGMSNYINISTAVSDADKDRQNIKGKVSNNAIENSNEKKQTNSAKDTSYSDNDKIDDSVLSLFGDQDCTKLNAVSDEIS